MPLSVNELQPGDRVVLNCPKARTMPKREAQFEGIFATLDEAQKSDLRAGMLIQQKSVTFLRGGAFARFLMGRMDGWDCIAAFVVEPDGSMREEEGRRIFIERRMRMGQG
jgi:hypothetical protein